MYIPKSVVVVSIKKRLLSYLCNKEVTYMLRVRVDSIISPIFRSVEAAGCLCHHLLSSSSSSARLVRSTFSPKQPGSLYSLIIF